MAKTMHKNQWLFEKWAASQECDLTVNALGPDQPYYADILTEDRWQCWQAALRECSAGTNEKEK